MWRQDRHGDFEEPVKAASAEPAGATARRERELHTPCKKKHTRKEFKGICLYFNEVHLGGISFFHLSSDFNRRFSRLESGHGEEKTKGKGRKKVKTKQPRQKVIPAEV